MLINQMLFFIMLALIGLAVGVLVFFGLKIKIRLSERISGAVATVLAFLVTVTIFNSKTSVIIINKGEGVRYALLGTSEYTFENNKKIQLHQLNEKKGELIINDSNDSCVIQRADYGKKLPDRNEELGAILFLCKPQESFEFKGGEIDYLFENSPEKITVKKRMNYRVSELIKYELRFFSEEDWENYYIYDGEVSAAAPNGEGKYYFFPDDYYEGEFLDGNFHGNGKLFNVSSGVSKKGTWFENEYIEE